MTVIPHLEEFGLSATAFSVRADGRTFTPETMTPDGSLRWRDGEVSVGLDVSSTSDGSSAVTLRIDGVRRVQEICLLDHTFPSHVRIHNHRWFNVWGLQRSTAVFVRDADGGLFACYANPFGAALCEGTRLRLSYAPGMDVAGSYVSDPLIVGRFARTGRTIRRQMLPGRDVVFGREPGYAQGLGDLAELDSGEVDAVRRAVAARVPWDPARTRVSHWDWGENMFRLQISDAETRDRYARAAELAAEIGVETFLIAPGHREGYVHGEDATVGDAPWQAAMWLGMGMVFGRGEWEPGAEPEGLPEVMADVRARGMGIAAYTNPQYMWLHEEAWYVEPDEAHKNHPYRWTCLGHREARDWLIRNTLAFMRHYELQGISLDFVFWSRCHATDHGHEPGEDSVYSQWDGYRRLIAAIRREFPDVWIETLIGSQQLMPWGSLHMTHPHPAMGDNQPQWVPAWPDLSQYRAQGNYQRRVGYWFRNLAFTPSYKIPGQVGFQANRRRWFPVERGWDWEGARYNLLSAIATGGCTLSVCFLPAWDEGEWEAMRERDGEFFARWVAFAKENAHLLARTEDLFEEARPGSVDGTAALDDDGRGFVFLANPDYRPLQATVPRLQDRLLRELHPVEGRLWSAEVTVEPHEVYVLEVIDAADVQIPAVLGAAATADAEGSIRSASGVPGTGCDVIVMLGRGARTRSHIRFASDGVIPTLGPWSDVSGAEVDLAVAAGRVRVTTDWVPGEALPALLARMRPGVEPEGDEVLQPWSDPSRLRIFPELLDPGSVQVRMWVDGDEVEVSTAYMGTFEDVKDPERARVENNTLGRYADLTDRLDSTSDLGRPWRIELEAELTFPGQLRGVHVAHLPRRWTDRFEVVEQG